MLSPIFDDEEYISVKHGYTTMYYTPNISNEYTDNDLIKTVRGSTTEYFIDGDSYIRQTPSSVIFFGKIKNSKEYSFFSKDTISYNLHSSGNLLSHQYSKSNKVIYDSFNVDNGFLDTREIKLSDSSTIKYKFDLGIISNILSKSKDEYSSTSTSFVFKNKDLVSIEYHYYEYSESDHDNADELLTIILKFDIKDQTTRIYID